MAQAIRDAMAPVLDWCEEARRRLQEIHDDHQRWAAEYARFKDVQNAHTEDILSCEEVIEEILNRLRALERAKTEAADIGT